MGAKRCGGPFLPNLESIIAAGINPKTGLPIKLDDACNLKSSFKHRLRVIDEQEAVNRYKWFNLPNGITPILLERMLYYKGQLAFFYIKELEKFFILPYALTSVPDCYGRFMEITPLPFAGKTATDENGNEKPWINGLKRKPVYDRLELFNNHANGKLSEVKDIIENGCVLLKDYTPQINEQITPRYLLQEPVLDMMSEIYPLARTAMISTSGIRAIRVGNSDEESNVTSANHVIYNSALNGEPFVAITGSMEFQDLTNTNGFNSTDYLQQLQSLDNMRLTGLGLNNGGFYQKKEHMLEAEQEMNMGHANLVYQDGLIQRQEFCRTVNSIWGLGIWCDECVTLKEKNSIEMADEYDEEEVNSEEEGI